MSQQNSKKKRSKPYLALSGAGVQMGVIIGAFAWLGTYLDSKYEHETSWWTLSLCLIGVFIGLYMVIKEVIIISQDADEKN